MRTMSQPICTSPDAPSTCSCIPADPHHRFHLRYLQVDMGPTDRAVIGSGRGQRQVQGFASCSGSKPSLFWGREHCCPGPRNHNPDPDVAWAYWFWEAPGAEHIPKSLPSVQDPGKASLNTAWGESKGIHPGLPTQPRSQGRAGRSAPASVTH